MIKQSPDTPFNIEKAQIDLIRKAPVRARISRVRSLSQTTIMLSRRAIQRSKPDLNEMEQDIVFVSLHYGEILASRLRTFMESNKS